MLKLGNCLPLQLQPLGKFRVVESQVVKQLNCDNSLETFMSGPVDYRHPSTANWLQDLVSRDFRQGMQNSGVAFPGICRLRFLGTGKIAHQKSSLLRRANLLAKV
jgi:hypothetical protein